MKSYTCHLYVEYQIIISVKYNQAMMVQLQPWGNGQWIIFILTFT